MRAADRLEYLLANYDFDTVVDWGCGYGPNHRDAFKKAGKTWHGIELHMNYGEPNYPADCLWACHTLEHVLNIHETLVEWYDKYLKPGGIVCVSVPEYEPLTKSGHIHHFHAGTLMYRLILAGFDCRDAAVRTADRNITVIARKPVKPIGVIDIAKMDLPDLTTFAPLFPKGASGHGFNGEIERLNWKS